MFHLVMPGDLRSKSESIWNIRYMDAVAGFAGHHARVERQVCRIMRKDRHEQCEGRPVVWASYEDPSQPDIIHNRIIRADDYLSANSIDGSNTQQHSRAILVFLFTFWEDEIRPRLASPDPWTSG